MAQPSSVVDMTSDQESELSELSDAATPPPPSSPPSPILKQKRPAPSTAAAEPPKKAKPSPPTESAAPKPKTLASLFGRPELSYAPSKLVNKPAAKPKPPTAGSNGSAKPAITAASKHGSDRATADDTKSAIASLGKGPNEGKRCHHHRRPCSTPLLQCTFMRGSARCPLNFCYGVLKSIYDQDAATIVKSGRLMVDDSQHCPSTEAKYAFKCPRCRQKCVCSICRKKGNLPPLGRAAAPKSNGGSPTTPSLVEEQASDKAKGKGKSKADQAHDGIITPPLKPQSIQNGLPVVARPRPPQPRILKPPRLVEAPVMEPIETRLPHENLRARMWLYESFVRFDKIGLPRSELNHLDRFESWSHARVREMLSTLLRYLAGLTNIEKGQPTKNTTKAVLAFRKYGGDLSRGEPWSAVREMLARLKVSVQELPFVDHPLSLELENRAVSPPLPRDTRSRRAKDGRQISYARQLGMFEEDFDGEPWENDDDEGEIPDGRRQGQKATRRLAADSDEEAETQATESEEDESSRDDARRSLRRQDKSRNATEMKQENPSVEKEVVEDAPDMETKVALLSALVDAALVTEELAEELKLALDEITALEKQFRADTITAEKEIAEQLAELNKRAPSLIAPDFQAWKTEKADLERDIKWRRLDAKVFHEIHVDAHALRTGPIGYDADGREYWHLREYNDHMPRQTEGRYSWCLIVLGPPFPAPKLETRDSLAETEAPSHAGGIRKDLQDEPPKGTSPSKKERPSSAGLYVDIPLSSAFKPDHKGPRIGSAMAKGKAEQPNKQERASSQANPTSICMGTNDPHVIASLIDYVRFRAEWKQYQEDRDMQQRELASRAASSGASPAPAMDDGDVSMADSPVESKPKLVGLKAAKQMLKEQQEERRTNTENLVKRLEKSRDYFAWHREEVLP